MGKSAGGAIAMYIAKMNLFVDRLFLCAPGTNTGGTLLKDRIGRHPLDIKLSWNKDDTVIHSDEHKIFVSDFEKQGNTFLFYLYDEGGHELNVNFLMEL